MSDTTKPVWDPTDPYDQYLYELMTTEYEGATGREAILPLRLPRVVNICDRCEKAPTPNNPMWFYGGQDADLENGPSEDDIPHKICERCMSTDNPDLERSNEDQTAGRFDER